MNKFTFSRGFSLLVCAFIYKNLAAEILPIPESARPYGMGNAFSAVANDWNAILFNPAGLSTVRQIEASGTAGRTLASGSPKTDLMAAAAIPLSFYKDAWTTGTAGFLLHSNGGSGENANTTLAASAGVAPYDFMPERFRVITPYLKIPERLHVGGTFRFRRTQHGVTGGTAYGMGIDLGFLYQFEDNVKTLLDGWSVALAFQEMNTGSVGGGSVIRLGSAWRHQRYTFALDMVTQGGVTRFMPGAEASFFRKLLLLRAGTGVVPEQSRQIVVGIGTLLPPIELDLAYGFPIADFDRPNDRVIVSFTYRFGTPFLGQYLEEGSRRESAKTEMSLANLEYKKATLEAGIRENRALYEKIDADLKKTRLKTETAISDLEAASKKLAGQNEKMVKLNRQIEELEKKKADTEEALRKYSVLVPEMGRKVFQHKVQKGDTLRSLAEKYYGDTNKWTVIFEANKDKIKRGALIEGEDIVVP